MNNIKRIIESTIKEYLKDNNHLIEVIPNKYVYHTSNPIFRDTISKEGLRVKGKGDAWLSDTKINGEVIFVVNSYNKKDWWDSTYDDDIYRIDTTNLNNKWYNDPNFDLEDKRIITFENIPLNSIKLIYKGTAVDTLKESINIENPQTDEYSDIDNDYGIKDINNVHSDIAKISKEAIKRFKSEVKLFNDIRIVFVNNIGEGALGRFRSGTSSSTPIVLLSEKDILMGSKKYDVPLWVAVETTIFHELGHAICELEYDIFGYEYLEYGDEEDWVENFAYELHEYGDIPQDLKNFIRAYKKQK